VTAGVPEFVRTTILSFTFDFRSTTVGVVVVTALLILLVVREIARANASPRTEEQVEVLNVAILPLLIAFGTVIVVRMVQLL
jgi:hypothetical protein